MVFKIQKKQKGVSPLITAVLIIFISIAVAGIIIIFSNAYFGTLGDIQKYKNILCNKLKTAHNLEFNRNFMIAINTSVFE